MTTSPSQLEGITASASFFVICSLGLSLFFFPCSLSFHSLLYIHFLSCVLCLLCQTRALFGENNPQRMRRLGKHLHAKVIKRFQVQARSNGECLVCDVCVEERAFFLRWVCLDNACLKEQEKWWDKWYT